MEPFTFFDSTGLTEDEEANIRSIVEYAANKKGDLFEPTIDFKVKTTINESKDVPINFNDTEISIDQMDESHGVARAEANHLADQKPNGEVGDGMGGQASRSSDAPKTAVNSWSGLFSKTPGANHVIETRVEAEPGVGVAMLDQLDEYPALGLDETAHPRDRKGQVNFRSVVPVEEDPLAPTLKGLLADWSADPVSKGRPIRYTARPLVNEGNWCYVNSVLQALLSLPPFYSLFSTLASGLSHHPNFDSLKSSAPTTLAFSRFVAKNYGTTAVSQTAQPTKSQNCGEPKPGGPRPLQIGNAFKPDQIYEIVPLCLSSHFSGKQEDAEELLSSLLNALHEEALAHVTASHVTPTGDQLTRHVTPDHPGDEWEKVGRKGRSTLTRETKISVSPVSALFGGVLRSHLQHQCCKGSATLQPFFVLPLDIQPGHVGNLNEALQHTFSKEHLPDYQCLKSHKSVDAYRVLQIETLPAILIFQIKSFLFDYHKGCSQKLLKTLTFPETLELNREILSQPVPQALRTYQLRAVIWHVGKSIQGGHYVTSFKYDTPFSSAQEWLLADDANISKITVDEINATQRTDQQPRPPQSRTPISTNTLSTKSLNSNVTPYLLFYTKANHQHPLKNTK